MTTTKQAPKRQRVNVAELVTEVTRRVTSTGRRSGGQQANVAMTAEIAKAVLEVLGGLPACVTGELLARYAPRR